MQRSVSPVAWVLVGAVALALVAGVALAQEEPTPSPAANESATPVDQHDDPSNVSEAGDLGGLSDWLGGHLADRLEAGAIELSQGQYDRVEGLLGDEFESRLSQFVDVAGETSAAGDDRAASRVEAAAADQRALGSDVAAYRETLTEYRAARAAGDNAEARERARALADLAAAIQDNGTALQAEYRAIENATGRNLTAGQRAIEEVVANVSTTQAAVRETTFVETRLSVGTNRSVAAFDRPARIEGRLVAENGTALADRSVTIRVGNRPTTVTTDAEGRFAVTYRPVSMSTDVAAVPVTYRPRSQSAFLGSSRNVSLSIDPVEPTVERTDAVESVVFGEAATATATVTVDGRPVPNASVSLAVGGYGLTAGRTDPSGEIRLSHRLPAAVDAGERTLTIVGGTDGRAIAPATVTTPVSVAVTATALSTTAASDGDAVVVSGTLRTDDGRPVANQSVAITAGAATRTVTTNATGGYAAALDRGAVETTGRTITVSATFDGTGTNLAGANATATASLPAASGAGGDVGGATDGVPWLVVAVGIGALAVLAGVVLVSIRWSQPTDNEAATGDVVDADRSVAATTDAERWLTGARTAFDAGDDRGAIARAYAASYAHLQARLGIGADRTPQELLAAAETGIEREELAALSTVADGYERTAFAGGRDVGAASVLESATRLVEGETLDADTTDD